MMCIKESSQLGKGATMSSLKDEVGSIVIETSKRHLRLIARRIVAHREMLGTMAIAAAAGVGAVLAGWSVAAYADTAPQSMSPSDINTPADSPAYVRPSYSKALASPLPSSSRQSDKPPAEFGSENYVNFEGLEGIYQKGGKVATAGNAFFRPLGSNGRTCFSCHKPDSGMGISASTIQSLAFTTFGTDPIFAPVDGANCPNKVPAENTRAALVGGARGEGIGSFYEAHSLLLDKGLIRIYLPLPKMTTSPTQPDLPSHPTEFTLSVVSDPNGCNTDPAYSREVDPKTGEVSQIISVYRRPIMASNLSFALSPAAISGLFGAVPDIDNFNGLPIVNPATGQPVSGNIMWDGREPTLQTQAQDAALIHEQAQKAPTAAQLAQIVGFESNTYAAQSFSWVAGDLTGHDGSGATGGPENMSTQPLTNFDPVTGLPGVYFTFASWSTVPDAKDPEQAALRQSIARGEDLYNNFQITLSNVGGFSNATESTAYLLAAPATDSCSGCHLAQAGTAFLPANLMNIGTDGDSSKLGGPAPSRDLPIFKLTCRAPYTTPYNGPVVYTNDPGMALITGQCADIGRKMIPQMRALASRAPYFSNGSAATLRDVVEFYDKRFTMKLTEQQKEDLVHFLATL
jgi:cytochrome c peroxidase